MSGGADSDIMLDLFCNFDKEKIHFIFLDTGLEYKATHEHLKYLEEKYNIEIERIRPKKPIPIACKEYGLPFLSKQVSEYIYRLQKHNFKWEDKTFEELYQEYPKCKAALLWWCDERGDKSMFSIKRNKWLKEFLIENPPPFKISNKCCDHTKKLPIKRYVKETGCDLNCSGVRRSEGGVRTTAYKNCFTDNSTKVNNKIDSFRPIFWFTNETKKNYEDFYNIIHSKCYTEYGLKRTGCAGCPYGRHYEEELEIIKKYEPNLYKAVMNIFGEAYEYTKKYREFVDIKNKEEKEKKLL